MQQNNGSLSIPRLGVAGSGSGSGGTSTPVSTPAPTNTASTKKNSTQKTTSTGQKTSLLEKIFSNITFGSNSGAFSYYRAPTGGILSPKYVYDPAANNALIPRAQSVSSNGGFINPLILPDLTSNPFLELNGIDDGTGNGNYYYIPYYNGGGGGGGSSYSVPRWMLNDIYWRL